MKKRYKLLASLVLIVSSINFAHAQYDHEAVFEGVEGDDLKSLLVENYKPDVVLGYGQARDTLYGIVYNVNDSIAGIYSDHKRYLKPGEDPTTYLFDNGEPNGINAEHSYPQSKGAGNGNAKSDMHHLFPSRVATNSARGSLPFAEINDNTTDLWFYKTQASSNIPSSSKIDLYSEKDNDFWEPREQVKGNIARAIFYFYTMYEQQALSADPDFFESMKNTLCQWHDLDPVDEMEWKRTKMIAEWQEGKSNPFILDCTLAARAYCSEISAQCIEVDVVNNPLESVRLQNNPVYDNAIFDVFTFDGSQDIHYKIVTMYGQIVSIGKSSLRDGENTISISMQDLAAGTYVIQLFVNGKYNSNTKVFKTLKI